MNTATFMFTILGTGVSLAGLMIGLVAWLRSDIGRVEDRLSAVEQRMDDRLSAVEQRMDDRLSAVEQRMDDRLSAVELSQAKLEGLLEGLREAIVGRTT